MRGYLTRTPVAVQRLYPGRTWRMPDGDAIYLTFDDGPIPLVTPWVLDQLDLFDAKATFFCIGANIERHPAIFKEILERGHSVGNHTFDHLNGKKVNTNEYMASVSRCEAEMDKYELSGSRRIFRPPYGRLQTDQAAKLVEMGYQVVMWEVLTGDFDLKRSGGHCLNLSRKFLRPGSIVVMHDSLKAEERLRIVLPGLLEFARENGWKCKALN